jgi:KDO2-lipid IV(A) lauroyltransferase
VVYTRLPRLLSPRSTLPFRAMRPLGALPAVLSPARRRLLADEFARSGLDADPVDAWRKAWRVTTEELVLGRHTRDTLDAFIRFEGIEHLDTARASGRGVVWVYPHAGPVMLMLGWLVQHGYPYTQYAARGLAPKEVAEAHPELLGHNRWRAETRAAREADEDKTGATFLTLAQPTRLLYRALARNELVGIAFDGRIGAKWREERFLGRRCLLNPGPWRLAASTGAALVPAWNHYPDDGPAVCRVGAPIDASSPDASAQVLAFAEAQIRASPAEYGSWLLHCRQRNGIDDHPLFIDHAADRAWERWAGPG